MDIIATAKEFSELIENKIFTFGAFTYQFKKYDEVSRDFKVNGRSIDKYELEEGEDSLYILLKNKPFGSEKSLIQIVNKSPLKIQLAGLTSKGVDLGVEMSEY